jgi:hypothetical protein
MSALAVEMLKLPEASPPVPQVSIASGGASTASAFARMIRAAPVISSIVSPRTLSAIKKAPICDGVALPLMMMSNAASASLSLSLWPCATCASSALKSGMLAITPDRRADRLATASPYPLPIGKCSYISLRYMTGTTASGRNRQGTPGIRVPDAHLVALAIEPGVTLCSTDVILHGFPACDGSPARR